MLFYFLQNGLIYWQNRLIYLQNELIYLGNNKIYKNKDENKPRLEKDVNWMKSKGYIKEMTDEIPRTAQMSGSGLSNL